jgi:outer membrane protein OmpA-like peptidoglycan-associated protein
VSGYADPARSNTETDASTHAPGYAEESVQPKLSPVGLLSLQRTAGNAAVCGMLSRTRAPLTRQPTLARFVGSEHKDLGDTTGASIDLGNGVVLSWGDVIALAGDQYATLEDLLADTRSEDGKTRLRAALEHDGIPGTIAARLPAPTADQRTAHEAKFIRLAMTNTAHFPDGGAALGAWAQQHAIAIETAVQAGLANDPSGMAMAYANEAFAEHFLTDCFSGGHIRTPRTQIVDYYVGTFAPRVTGPLLANLRTRLIEALVREASPQTSVPDWKLTDKISDRVNPGIDGAIATLGGMGKLAEFVGLGVAGAISGAMHDQEGEQGVMVASDDHPDPWRAYGDAGLTKSPVSREQATSAIAEAKAQVDAAFLIGQEESVTRDSVPADPPVRVHFAFNSSALSADATNAVTAAAAYMAYRPEAVLDITGHTDPIGSDDANDALGQTRADAVLTALSARGVVPDRVHAHTMGEHALVTRDPKRYSENRRADFGWATGSQNGGGGTQPSDSERATTRAMTRAQQRADTALVLHFVPRPVEERAQGSVPDGNTELPDWHWGRLDPSFRGKVDDWIRGAVGTKLESALDGVPQLDPATETVPLTGTEITVHPRDRAKEIVRALMVDPTAQLGALMGETPFP